MANSIKIQISDEHIQDIIDLLDTIRTAIWGLGDYLAVLVDAHGMENRSEVFNSIASQTRATYSQLDDYERTSRKWAEADRLPNLSWTIYRNADPEEDMELIQQAADEGWNATRFKEEKYPAITRPQKMISHALAILNRLVSMQEDKLPKLVLERLLIIIEELEDLLGEVDDDEAVRFAQIEVGELP